MRNPIGLCIFILFILWGNNIYSLNSAMEETMFAFPGWNRKQAITIQANQVEGSTSLVDFPVLITLDHLNDEIVDGGANSALNGGGDIRFSSDASGNNQLAVEVVEFVTSATPANRRCQIWVKVPSLSTTINTTIYIWYNKAGEVQPPVHDSHGSQAVWDNYDFVTHDMRTESSSGKTITLNNAAGLAPGPFGTSVSDFNGSTNFHTWDPSDMAFNTQRTISVWANFDASTSTIWRRMFQLSQPVNNVSVQLAVTDGRFIFGTDDTNEGHVQQAGTKMLEGFLVGNWHRVTGSWTTLETGTELVVNNGSPATINALDVMGGGASSQTARFGNRSDANNYYDGKMACFTISKDLLSDAYVATEYNNQSNPTTFAIAGNPENGSSGGGGDTQAPSVPTGLQSTSQSQTTADLSWNSSTDNVGVTGYRIYKDGSLEASLGNVTSHQVTGLTVGTTYSFTVSALDATGNESAQSTAITVTTDTTSGGGGSSVWSETGSTASYTGDVAIGTGSVPTGYKLAVDGNIRTREIRVDQDTWPDYVFEEGYDLPTLEEIQEYIKEKGHLPNIPSAKEVEANGVDVGDMNKLLLEKIEELTLFVIQQKELHEQQQGEIDALKAAPKSID